MKISKLLITLLSVGVLLTACRKDETVTPTQQTTPTDTSKTPVADTSKPTVKKDSTLIYIVNYGSYGTVKGEISRYNDSTKKLYNGLIASANGATFSSNIQSIATYNGVMYCMSNSADKIDVLDAKTLKTVASPISGTITKPRYFVANGNLGYVSCFGEPGDASWTTMPNSYIAVIDLKTNTYLRKIAVPNATEGMIIAEGKLFVALEYKNQIAVIDLVSEAISYIDVPALGQQFVLDKNGMLWVSMVSEYTVSFEESKRGLALIDPKTNTYKTLVNIPGISSDGYLAINKSKDKVFVLTKESYPGTKSAIYSISVDAKTVSTSAVVSGESYNSFGFDTLKSRLYVLIGAGSSNGKLQIYSENGVKEGTDIEVGVSPQQVYFDYSTRLK